MVRQQILFSCKFSSSCNSKINFFRNDIREFALNAFFNNVRRIEEYEKDLSITNEEERKQIINYTLLEMTIFNAPLIPHICEEIYERAGQEGMVSFAQFPEINLTDEDKIIITQGKFIASVQDDIDHILKMMEHRPHQIFVYINATWKTILYSKLKSHFENSKITMSEIMKIAKNEPKLQSFMPLIAAEGKMIVKNPSILKIDLLDQPQQIQALEDHIPMFQAKYAGIKLEVINSDAEKYYDPKKRAKKARPMKPALYME